MEEKIINTILQHKSKIERGGKEVRWLATAFYEEQSEDCTHLAQTLFAHNEVAVKMVAVYLYGILATHQPDALLFLKNTVSRDPDWRVQEILAQAFDRYCADIGYETALPTITNWLEDAHHNVRRAAAEGPRIWTTRPYFKEHPEKAIQLLSTLKGDDSEYVRKSAGNALRDISRKYPQLLHSELQTWDRSDKKILFTYILASKFLEG